MNVLGIEHRPAIAGDQTVGSSVQLIHSTWNLCSSRSQCDVVLIPPSGGNKPIEVWRQDILFECLTQKHGALQFVESHHVDPMSKLQTLSTCTGRKSMHKISHCSHIEFLHPKQNLQILFSTLSYIICVQKLVVFLLQENICAAFIKLNHLTKL